MYHTDADVKILMDAARTGNVSVIELAADLGVPLTSNILDQAAVSSQKPCIDILAKQKGISISGFAIESLVLDNNVEMLTYLITKRMVSFAGVLSLAHIACNAVHSFGSQLSD